MSAATTSDYALLAGANAAMPLRVSMAAAAAGARVLHVSSAAGQGRLVLNESMTHAPFSAYSFSKALAERALADTSRGHLRIFRPTSVHGADRDVTRHLVRLARSRFATVMAPGTQHTPQVHVLNVAAAAIATLFSDNLPEVVLQPSEGWTVEEFMETMGSGHSPRLTPKWIAAPFLATTGRLPGSTAKGWHRRLEVLLCGQEQESSSLQGIAGPADRDHWRNMARDLASQ